MTFLRAILNALLREIISRIFIVSSSLADYFEYIAVKKKPGANHNRFQFVGVAIGTLLHFFFYCLNVVMRSLLW